MIGVRVRVADSRYSDKCLCIGLGLGLLFRFGFGFGFGFGFRFGFEFGFGFGFVLFWLGLAPLLSLYLSSNPLVLSLIMFWGLIPLPCSVGLSLEGRGQG